MEFKLQKFDTPLNVSRIANIHYFEFTEQYHTFSDSHNFCELLYVDNGTIMVEAENFSGELTGNQLIIHTPDEKHSLTCIDNSCPNIIIIGFECKSEDISLFSYSPVTLRAEHKKMLSEIMKEGMNVFTPPYDIPYTTEMTKREKCLFGAEQMLKINLEAFLISLVREHQQSGEPIEGNIENDGKIADVYNYINEHFTEKITLNDICLLFGTNKTTLCHSFKEAYGTTILDYINKLKIRQAKRLIREQKLSVTEISEFLGFTSIHYFSRLFKNSTGLSPKEYLKTVKAKLEL